MHTWFNINNKCGEYARFVCLHTRLPTTAASVMAKTSPGIRKDSVYMSFSAVFKVEKLLFKYTEKFSSHPIRFLFRRFQYLYVLSSLHDALAFGTSESLFFFICFAQLPRAYVYLKGKEVRKFFGAQNRKHKFSTHMYMLYHDSTKRLRVL